jgi:hypothetical protein
MMRPMLSAARSRPVCHPATTRLLLSPLTSPGLLALAMLALLSVLSPQGEFPINDDWVHARVVQVLLERGRLESFGLDWPVARLPGLLGALFAEVFGFSHTVLRASTLALAAAGVLACYALLRDLLGPARALLGALVLLINPLFVNLSYSFMTDVPFLSLALCALAVDV